MTRFVDRRSFLGTSAALAALAGATRIGFAAEKAPLPIYKTLKVGMISEPGSIEVKLRVAKEAGFDGLELDSPGNPFKVEDIKAAIEKIGIPVDGTVCSSHWTTRHSSPDAAVRAKALEDLKVAIRETHAIGGHTVLLVVGHGEDGPEADIWGRSIENIRKALPLCGELGIYIAIENVWNHFLYDHKGNNEQTADKFAKYVDEFDSPWVGMQFDIGNHWKYGDPAAWIQTLGKRVVKLDIKGFSRAKNTFTKNIVDGDIDFKSVRRALTDIGFTGWCAAELGPCSLAELTAISKEMDQVLELKK